MVSWRQIFFSVVTTSFWQTPTPVQINNVTRRPKSVAVVGAGSAGIAMLKTLLDLPNEVRRDWEIVLFEQRRDVGGIWLPDSNPPPPPNLPETPLYPRLRTNTPVPSMSYPGHPFPPNTPLYPSHNHVESYLKEYATKHDLFRYIRLNHTVLASSWIGNSTAGYWNVTFRDSENNTRFKGFDHLSVASGHNHEPFIPSLAGEKEWLAGGSKEGPKREALHSIWYRGPERFANRTVIVIGGGSSGTDVATQIAPIARKTYLSERKKLNPPVLEPIIGDGVIRKGEISHFTADHIVFQDGTTATADFILYGTGYELRIPFLDEGNALRTDPHARSNGTSTQGLITNLRYLFPLYKHIISLCPTYPTNALSFIGLPLYIANCPSDIAQSLFAVHSIVNPDLLPSREEMLSELAAYEDNLRSHGFDPDNIGHRLLNNTSSDYQDDLVDYLKGQGALPNDGKKFVEGWRREIFEFPYLKRGWRRVEELGQQKEWLAGVKTEKQWSSLMRRLNAWQRDWEEKVGIAKVYDDGFYDGW